MKKNILIIGGGIHGCFLAKYLSNYKVNVFLIEKRKDICLEASAATHNRANRGFHYPRSNQTTSECKVAYQYFQKNYKSYLKKSQSYYCIENNSKISFKNYFRFFKKNGLQFNIVKKSKFIKNDKISGIIKGEEGCYDHFKIKKMLQRKLTKKNIYKIFNFNLKKVEYKKNKSLRLISEKNRFVEKKIDLIVNATYDYSNEILKIFSLNKKIKKYLHQLTEVVVVKSKKVFPGVTIMDGPFATVMPYIGKKNKYLLYDVTNSILKKSNKPIPKQKIKSNFRKIKKKLDNYLNYTNQFRYSNSLIGNRPIPYKDTHADRSTKIEKCKYKNINFLSIREGKYISAPYITKNLSKKIIKYLNAK